VKSRMFRAIGIASALLVPVASLALGAGTAGATTSTVHLKATFTFTTPGGINTLHCPTSGTFTATKTTTGVTVQIKNTDTQVLCKIATGGPTHIGIPKTSTVHLLITGGWLLYNTSTKTGKIKGGKLEIKIKFSNTATCQISFPTTITTVTINGSLTKASIGSTPTSGATVSGTTATCGALRSLLDTSSSSFAGSVSGI
jgi:hypothetical protein